MSNELVELTEETSKDTVMAVFTGDNGLDPYVQQVRDEVSNFDHDLSTGAGRKRTASLSAKVSKMKVRLDTLGKDLVGDWKKKAKTVDEARKKMREDLDFLRDEARKPLTDWEQEQKRIEAEEAAAKAAQELMAKIEQDHEIALLMNEKFDRELAEQKAKDEAERIAAEQEAERLRIEKENQMKAEAAESARVEAERKAKEEQDRVEQEKQEAIQREINAKAAEQLAVKMQKEAEERERQAVISAENQRIVNERAAKQAEIDAESKRLADIESARLAEVARQEAEKKQIEAEKAAREADKSHRAAINNQILIALTGAGITEDDGKKVITMLAKGLLPNAAIHY